MRQIHDAPKTNTVAGTPPEQPAAVPPRDHEEPATVIDLRHKRISTVHPAPPQDPPEIIDLRTDATPARTKTTPTKIDTAEDDAESLLRRIAALPEGSLTRAALRQQVVESELSLVRHLAQRFRGRGEPLDDLIQVGAIGLLHAIDRFDPKRGGFTAFAVPTIVGEIRRHFRDRGWALRVPRRLQDLGRHVAQAREELTHLLERSPTAREVADRLGIEPELVLEAMETSSAQVTVPLPSASEENSCVMLGVADHGLNLVEDRVTLQPLLARLPARERTILALRFVQGLSQSQIAQEVGVSQMHVSRLITRSLATLRQGLVDTP